MEERLKQLLGEGWFKEIGSFFSSPHAESLLKNISNARKQGVVFPEKDKMFNAFKQCPYEDLKVLIIGQDPYHYSWDGTPVADGLAFSSQVKEHRPRSLEVIFRELDLSYDYFPPYDVIGNPNLKRWANQGVLLLNTCLTVTQAQPNSHQEFGWSRFVTGVIRRIANKSPLVVMLWGREAKMYAPLFKDNDSVLILRSAHPAVHAYDKNLPVKASDKGWSSSRCFIGNRHFKKANEYLIANNKEPIEWIEGILS